MQRVLTHFGEPMRHSPYGLRVTRGAYSSPLDKRRSLPRPAREMFPTWWEEEAVHFEDDEHRIYKDKNAEWMHARAMRNFDLNMAFFNRLDSAEFEAALQVLRGKHKWMKPVLNLPELNGREGVYVIVLDQYKQAYIGQSSDMRRRILEHWHRRKSLDRQVFGSEEESVLSIDSFRPMDTTRILAGATGSADHWEPRMVSRFPKEFLLNRMGGGRGNLAALTQENRRVLVP